MTTPLPYRPNPLEYPLGANGVVGLNDTIENIYTELRRLYALVAEIDTSGGAGSTTPHNLLSAIHPDTTVDAEVDGDIIIGSGSTWRRLPKSTNLQFLQLVAGLPAWGVDGSLLTSIPASSLTGTLPVSSYQHNLLSTAHPDTQAASPAAGSLVSGQGATSSDLGRYFLRGRRARALVSGKSTGGRAYWLRGGAARSLIVADSIVWAKLALGAAGTVPTSTGTGIAWQTVSAVAGSFGAMVYRSTDVLIADLTPTSISLDTVTTDDGTYWTGAAPARLTVPATASGWHVIVAQASYQIGTVAAQWLSIFINGVERARTAAAFTNSAKNEPHQCAIVVKLNAGDYVEMKAEHAANAAGTAFFIRGGSASTFLSIVKV